MDLTEKKQWVGGPSVGFILINAEFCALKLLFETFFP